MKKTLASLITVSFLLGSAVASAANDQASMKEAAPPAAQPSAKPASTNPAPTANAEDMFKKLDKNHDGMIDKNEAKADKALSKEFKKVAKNGKLDQQGYNKWEQSHQHMTN